MNCDCELALKFNRQPLINTFKNIGWINDQYYLPKLYECNECHSKWITYFSDDSLGEPIWEKYSLDDRNITEYY